MDFWIRMLHIPNTRLLQPTYYLFSSCYIECCIRILARSFATVIGCMGIGSSLTGLGDVCIFLLFTYQSCPWSKLSGYPHSAPTLLGEYHTCIGQLIYILDISHSFSLASNFVKTSPLNPAPACQSSYSSFPPFRNLQNHSYLRCNRIPDSP